MRRIGLKEQNFCRFCHEEYETSFTYSAIVSSSIKKYTYIWGEGWLPASWVTIQSATNLSRKILKRFPNGGIKLHHIRYVFQASILLFSDAPGRAHIPFNHRQLYCGQLYIYCSQNDIFTFLC